MNTRAAIVIRRITQYASELIGGGSVTQLVNGQWGFATEDRSLVVRDLEGFFYRISTDDSIAKSSLVKDPSQTVAELPESDQIGTLRMVLQTNSYWFKSLSNWIEMPNARVMNELFELLLALRGDLNNHISDIIKHTTQQDRNIWNAKAQSGSASASAGNYITGITLNPNSAPSIAEAPLPTPPAVNNSTISFTQGGANKGSFTLNQSLGATIALDAGVTGISTTSPLSSSAVSGTVSLSHLSTDGNRHVPATAAADANKFLKSNSAPGGVPSWASLTASDVGLGNVNNTSDANKPISMATQTALNGKADTANTMPAPNRKLVSMLANGTTSGWKPIAYIRYSSMASISDGTFSFHAISSQVSTNITAAGMTWYPSSALCFFDRRNGSGAGTIAIMNGRSLNGSGLVIVNDANNSRWIVLCYADNIWSNCSYICADPWNVVTPSNDATAYNLANYTLALQSNIFNGPADRLVAANGAMLSGGANTIPCWNASGQLSTLSYTV